MNPRKVMGHEAEYNRVKGLLGIALLNITDATESPLWSYIREYDLGKLDVAKSILVSIVSELESSVLGEVIQD